MRAGFVDSDVLLQNKSEIIHPQIFSVTFPVQIAHMPPGKTSQPRQSAEKVEYI